MGCNNCQGHVLWSQGPGHRHEESRDLPDEGFDQPSKAGDISAILILYCLFITIGYHQASSE